MRDPKGKSIPSHLYAALVSRCVRTGDPRLREKRMQEGYEMAFAWEIVSRRMQYRARRDVATASEMLMYIQAVDRPKKIVEPHGVGKTAFRSEPDNYRKSHDFSSSVLWYACSFDGEAFG